MNKRVVSRIINKSEIGVRHQHSYIIWGLHVVDIVVFSEKITIDISGSAVPFRSGRADLGPFRAVPFCRVPRGVGVGLKRCHLRFLRVWKCR